jgi:hypothetical protein
MVDLARLLRRLRGFRAEIPNLGVTGSNPVGRASNKKIAPRRGAFFVTAARWFEP